MTLLKWPPGGTTCSTKGKSINLKLLTLNPKTKKSGNSFIVLDISAVDGWENSINPVNRLLLQVWLPPSWCSTSRSSILRYKILSLISITFSQRKWRGYLARTALRAPGQSYRARVVQFTRYSPVVDYESITTSLENRLPPPMDEYGRRNSGLRFTPAEIGINHQIIGY